MRNGVLWNRPAEFGSDFRFRVSIANSARNNAKRCFRDQNLFGSVCARTRSMRGSACTSVLLMCLTIFGRGAPQESYSGETCIAEQYGRKRST